MKIIVAEDQMDLQEALVYFLCRIGYAAIGVSNGRELDQAMARSQPNLLLLDIGLPGEDGVDIARRLRDAPGPTIAMLTARSGKEDRIHSFESGADNFLVKPVDYRELQAVLERVSQRLPGLLIEAQGHSARLTMSGALRPRSAVCARKSAMSRPAPILSSQSGCGRCVQGALRSDMIFQRRQSGFFGGACCVAGPESCAKEGFKEFYKMLIFYK